METKKCSKCGIEKEKDNLEKSNKLDWRISNDNPNEDE